MAAHHNQPSEHHNQFLATDMGGPLVARADPVVAQHRPSVDVSHELATNINRLGGGPIGAQEHITAQNNMMS